MTQETATLVAAGIAATAAIVSLVFNISSNRSSEFRAAHREVLRPKLAILGKALHEVVATSSILLERASTGKDPQAWISRGASAADVLKQVRLELRYPLHGLDDALRTLSRSPEWTATYKGRKDMGAQALVDSVKKLAKATDKAIRKSYLRGRPPGLATRFKVNRAERRVRKTWAARFGGMAKNDPAV
jgi:hypothetical protein